MSQLLPPRPNLDQLKRQAKDLLKAYRSGDDAVRRLFAPLTIGPVSGADPLPPAQSAGGERSQRTPAQPSGGRSRERGRVRPKTASPQRPGLADAQRLLARQYGFASWSKLKRHVEDILASQLPSPAATPETDNRAARKLAQQQRIQDMAQRLLAATAQPEIQPVFNALFAPKRDMLAVRAYLIEHDAYAVVIDALLRGVADPNARIRYFSAQAMDHFADPRCAEPLRQLLRDPVPRVRWAALHSLSCDECKIQPLCKPDNLLLTIVDLALHDPSIKVRRVAAWELGKLLPDKTALEILETLLAHETDRGIRRNVQAGLNQYAKSAARGR